MEFGLESIRENAMKRNLDDIRTNARHNTAGLELLPRAPVVAIMGHVDHGKTTLMDTLRSASMSDGSTASPMAPSEAGGITQKLSAFEIFLKPSQGASLGSGSDGDNVSGGSGNRKVVFLDTPGHAAFSSMRKNGTLATDIAVILIALDDGIRPQTIEAIRIAQKHECSIFIGLNKIDKFPLASDRQVMRRKILASLVEYDILTEDLGGEIQVVEMSGKTSEGMTGFIEKLCLQADLLELKASYAPSSSSSSKRATGGGTGTETTTVEGIVLDTKVMKGRGVIADVLIRWGTLSVGDAFVINTTYGKVKSMENMTTGKLQKSAGPSDVIKLYGLNSIPTSGYELLGVETEIKAKQIAKRREKIELLRLSHEKYKRSQEAEERGSLVTVHIIIKSESVNGLSALQHVIENIQKRLQQQHGGGVCLHVISSSIGTINQSDITLASMSQEKLEHAVIIGFNVPQPLTTVRALAKENDVEIYTNDVLYRLEEAIEEVVKEHMPEERVLTVEV
jgi:translation initiation factor IF-2